MRKIQGLFLCFGRYNVCFGQLQQFYGDGWLNVAFIALVNSFPTCSLVSVSVDVDAVSLLSIVDVEDGPVDAASFAGESVDSLVNFDDWAVLSIVGVDANRLVDVNGLVLFVMGISSFSIIDVEDGPADSVGYESFAIESVAGESVTVVVLSGDVECCLRCSYTV